MQVLCVVKMTRKQDRHNVLSFSFAFSRCVCQALEEDHCAALRSPLQSCGGRRQEVREWQHLKATCDTSLPPSLSLSLALCVCVCVCVCRFIIGFMNRNEPKCDKNLYVRI